MAITPVTWNIISARMRDGDSVYLERERELFRTEDEIQIRRDAKPVLCRLTWLKCPEISGPYKDPINGPRATQDAQFWLDMAFDGPGSLLAIQYGEEKYGRPLVDIRNPRIDESLSVWMATVKKWDVYR